MAAMTAVTSGSAAVSARAWAPWRISGRGRPAGQAATKRARAASSGTITTRAVCRAACSASDSIRLYALRAWTENRSGWRATTSSVLTPMEPVEPRMQRRCWTDMVSEPVDAEE
jgi:hypothetical protein